MALIIKIIGTLFILFCGYWLSVELLWESDKVSDEYHEWLNEFGATVMALMSIGGVLIVFSVLVVALWTEI